MIGIVKYGDIQLECIRVNEVRRDVMLSPDNVDYYCTQVTVNLTAVWNPNATSYASLVGGVPQVGMAGAGRTDRMLFDYLSQPRRKLLMWTYDLDGSRRTYLESPPNSGRGTLPSDVKNGPICKVFSVTETFGVKTFDVNLSFTTWINNCYDKTSPIISHRWETYIDYDEDHFQITTTRGTCLFNVGRLWMAGQTPDMYREQLFTAPHPNFARDHVNVQISSDNTQATYTVVDRERPFNLGSHSPATRLEATLTTWVGHGSAMQAIANSAPSIHQHHMQMAATAPLLAIGPAGVAAWGVNAFRGMFGVGSTVLGNTVAELPKYYANIKVRAHGGRTTRRYDLAKLCLALAHSWLGRPTFFNLANKTEIILTQDVAGKFVELDMTLRWSDSIIPQLAGIAGPAASLGAILGSALTINGKVSRFLTGFYADNPGEISEAPFSENLARMENDPTLNLTQQGIYNRPMNTGQESPVQAVNLSTPYRDSRGPGSLQYVLTQALLGQCETPPPPPDLIYGQPTTPRDGIFTVPTVPIPLMPIS